MMYIIKPAIVKPLYRMPSVKPSLLLPIFKPLTALQGVGPKYGKLLANATGDYLCDLFWHLPVDVLDRTAQPKIKDLKKFHGQTITISVFISAHQKPPRKAMPYKVIARDETGFMELVFFGGKEQFWLKSLPVAAEKIISGKVDFFRDVPQISHPDYIGNPQDLDHIKGMEPLYGLTYGVTNKFMRKAVASALRQAPDLPEWCDTEFIAARQWPKWRDALQQAHHPLSQTDLSPKTPSRMRLAYDEILSHQLALTLIRNIERQKKINRDRQPNFHLRRKLLDALPFRLTEAQKSAMGDIDADMARAVPMLRLLQGDVGSGKTIVALLAMLNAAECGKQAAIMAPTEILARQHQQTITPLAETIGLRVATLTARDKGKSKAELLRKIAAHDVDIVIGTHALLEDKIQFKNLGLVVIDEQHRFGVEQRLRLLQKGDAVDMLVMTATPIPRSLFLAIYGDLDTSRLMQKPPGRKPIATRTVSVERIDDVVAGIGRAIEERRQIYWVCPLVAESEVLDLAAAEDRYQQLHKIFKDKVGLVHGRMKALDKDKIMQSFLKNEIQILVATTVIEVGVNVPNASIMVIDHAERFGLSQLHQLRGRIGRGSVESSCILLYQSTSSAAAKARLNIMRETDDGFVIAEEDLKLRGAGEILGTRQSGLPDFKLADFSAHQDLFKTAQKDVSLILQNDPNLQSSRGKNLRLLLHLFDRNQAVDYLHSG